MTLLDTDGIFSPVRIQKNTLPDGFYRYTLIKGTTTRFGAVQDDVTPDYAGDFLCKTPLTIGEGRALSSEDWTLHPEKPFVFEAFWGQKLSIDKQILNAEHKRDLALGKTPSGPEHDIVQDQSINETTPEQEDVNL